MSNKFFIGILVAIAVVFGFVLIRDRDNTTTSNTDTPSSQTASNHTKGSDTTGVVLVEYGDFQCPACGAYYPILKQIYEEYKDRITFQFRHFPLIQIHPNAMIAHRAAVAADKQGKFWEMHDKLYETQDQWSSAPNASTILEGFASDLGLDIDKFKQDAASAEVNALINADIREGQKQGANSTPTFVLDGVKIDNPKDIEGFKALLDEAIKKKSTS